MGTPVLLEQLMVRTLRRANLEGAREFILDDECIDNINVAISHWWDMVRLTTFAGQIARSTWPITTINNQSSYPLAPNTASIISVDIFIAGNQRPIPVQPYQEEQRGMFSVYPFVGWSPGVQTIWYQHQGSNINFLPLPTSQYPVQVNYCPTAPVLADPASDFLNSVNGWEEWVVLYAARLLLLKTGNTGLMATLEPLMQMEKERIERAAANLDMAAEGVHETESYGQGGFGSFFS